MQPSCHQLNVETYCSPVMDGGEINASVSQVVPQASTEVEGRWKQGIFSPIMVNLLKMPGP